MIRRMLERVYVFLTFCIKLCVRDGLAFESNIMLDKLYHWYNFKTFAFQCVKLLVCRYWTIIIIMYVCLYGLNSNQIHKCLYLHWCYRIWWPKFINKSKIICFRQTQWVRVTLDVNHNKNSIKELWNIHTNKHRCIKSPPPYWFQWCFDRYCLVILSHWKPFQRIL